MTIDGYQRGRIIARAMSRVLVCPDTGRIILNDKRGRKMPRSAVLAMIRERRATEQAEPPADDLPF